MLARGWSIYGSTLTPGTRELSELCLCHPTTVPNPIRWDTVAESRELHWTEDTLRRKLSQANQIRGLDGCFSTEQICAAIYGDIASESLRKTAAEADNWELKNAVMRGESLPRSLLTPALEQFTPSSSN